jgi:hypothetical protein
LLRPGRFRVYGVSESMMAASTELVTPHRSSTAIVQLTPSTRVKVEHAEELITILNDDSDGNSPAVASPIRSPLVNSSVPDSSQRSPIPLSHPLPSVATQDRVFPHYVPNSSIKHSKSDSKDRSQEIL